MHARVLHLLVHLMHARHGDVIVSVYLHRGGARHRGRARHPHQGVFRIAPDSAFHMQHGWTLYVRAMAQNMAQMRMGAKAQNIRKASVHMGAKARNEGVNIILHLWAKALNIKMVMHMGAKAQSINVTYGMGHRSDLG